MTQILIVSISNVADFGKDREQIEIVKKLTKSHEKPSFKFQNKKIPTVHKNHLNLGRNLLIENLLTGLLFVSEPDLDLS